MAAKKKTTAKLGKDDKAMVRTVGRENAKIRKGWAELLGTQMRLEEQVKVLTDKNKVLEGKVKNIMTDPIIAQPTAFRKEMDELKDELKALKARLAPGGEVKAALSEVKTELRGALDDLEGKVEDHAASIEALTRDVSELQEEATAPAPSPDNAPAVTPVARPSRQVDLQEAVAASKAANPTGAGTDFERTTSYTEKPVSPPAPYVSAEKDR